MRVFHGPVDVAWQGSTLAKELRRQGVDSLSLSYATRMTEADRTVFISRHNPISWLFKQVLTFFQYGFTFDIYHFHFAKSFLPLNLDLPILKIMGKKIVFHFHGCDVRDHLRPNVHCSQCNLAYRSVQQPITKFLAKTFANKVYVSTPDLLQDFPAAEHLPVAYPWKIQSCKVSGLRKIVHSSTDQEIKGTEYVLRAINQLRKDGKKFDFKFIEGMSHDRVQKIYQSSDLGIDQLLLGWYGLLSLEFLAQGKPVLCYIDKNLNPKSVPVLNTTPQMIYNDLRNILEGNYSFDAARAVSFVKRVHSPEVIVKRLIKDYSKL